MRRRFALVLLTGLVLLGLVVGAPSLDRPSDAGTDQDRDAGIDGPQRSASGADFSNVTRLQHLAVQFLIGIICLGALAYGLGSYGRDDYVLAFVSSVVMLVGATFVVGSQSSMAGGILSRSGELVSGGSFTQPTQAAESMWLVGAVGSVLVIGLAILALRRGTASESWVDPDDEADTDEHESDPSPTDLAAVAGRAADTLDSDGSLDNAVYQAWQEMTTLLDLERAAATTPGEFAEAAVAAGMDPDDVETLTELFERVRYGHQPITDDRERAAQTALRNIERTYGDKS